MIVRKFIVRENEKEQFISVKIYNPRKIDNNFETKLIIKGGFINFETKLYGVDSMQSFLMAFKILKAKIDQISNDGKEIFWLEKEDRICLDI
jgi:hypothetical protein